ncbi:hypothetical protein KFD70_11660 [Bacillus pfraonensis]|uniref:hypothetical protein n=1 Tax=Bacillus TaxID=1386 RepID=UPI002A5684C1|nr:hypothetical protein [Bacillus pseudomycoides]
MKNNFIQEIVSHITILILGTTFLYFNEEGFRSALIFASGYIILGLLITVVRGRLFKKKKKEQEQYPLPEMDERIEKLSLKFMTQIFGLSHLVGAAILFVLFITNKNSMIRVEYVLYYVMGVLFFTMMFGLRIVKRFDQ